MKGLYVYAIRRPVRDFTIFPKIEGVDKDGKVFPLFVGDGIEAVASLVPLDQYASEEIFEKAQNDLQWIKEKSLIHHQVIMKSAEGTDGAIVPMKFGLIFKDRQSLARSIKKDSKRFLSLFEKLKGKEEWSIKIFAGHDALKEEIVNSDPAFASKKRDIASLPVGLAYFKGKELEDEIEKRKEGEFQKWSQEILRILPRFADEAKLGKILGKELTGKTEPMILNAILLINKKKLNKFLREVTKWSGILKKKGLCMEASGPWPPYNFVD